MTVERRNAPLALLSGLRLIGGGAFLLPRVGVKQLGLHDDVESAYMMRLFAARNIAMTLGLLASNGSSRKLWWQAGIACDVLDAAAGLLALREGKPRQSAIVDTSASLVATGLGVAGLVTDGR
jgi:hypothetical protein